MNLLKYSIRDRNVQVLELVQYECRADNSLLILQEMVRREPDFFEGKDGIMVCNDHPPDHLELKDGELNFCSSKWRGLSSRFFPMPCPYSVGWPQVGIPDGDALTRYLLTYNPETVSNRIFWIGAHTHWTRARLCEMSREHPDQIQASMMGWGREGERVQLNPVGGYASLQDHAHHKYLIDCAGQGYSGRIRWLLATGRPVFIVDRNAVEHWHEALVPWEHFVPVREDLSDLLAAREILEQNHDLYEAIGMNARQFVKDRLVFDQEIAWNLRAITDTAANVTQTENMECDGWRTRGA